MLKFSIKQIGPKHAVCARDKDSTGAAFHILIPALPPGEYEVIPSHAPDGEEGLIIRRIGDPNPQHFREITVHDV